jgi:hypothetical protein
MTEATYFIQGNEVHLSGDTYLTSLVSEYLSVLYEGEITKNERPLSFEVAPAEVPPSLPTDATKIIQGPHATTCCSRDEILFLSKDRSSVITFDPKKGIAKGFFSEHLSGDRAKLFSLVGTTIVEMLKWQGRYFLHGACVSDNGTAYLFSGKSRSGKTTAAISLVWQGFHYVADDSLFFTERDRRIVVTPYYTHFHVDKNLAMRSPETSCCEELKDSRQDMRRVRVDMTQIYPDSFVPSLSPHYIIFPQIMPTGRSSFSSLSRLEVYRRLLKQTVLAADTAIAKRQLAALEKLTKQARGFELISGKDIYRDPTILVAILRLMDTEYGNTKEMQN